MFHIDERWQTIHGSRHMKQTASISSFLSNYPRFMLEVFLEFFQFQLNVVNSYMDLHLVYGRWNITNSYLRLFKDGTLNTTYRHGQVWPPDSKKPEFDCFSAPDAEICYKSCRLKIKQQDNNVFLCWMEVRKANTLKFSWKFPQSIVINKMFLK